MSEPRHSDACDCESECELCLILMGMDQRPLTPDQERAVAEFWADAPVEGTDGDAYRNMVAVGLPQWGDKP